MADRTAIEWTDATWNPVTGCSLASPGCTNCYAMKLAGGRLRHVPSRAGLTQASKAGPVWTGEVRFNEDALAQPLRWRRPRRVFVCAHGDLFHENVPDEWIDRVFAVMALAPQHTFQVLTKRAARMRGYFAGHPAVRIWRQTRDFNLPGRGEILTMDGRAKFLPLPNVWLGVSVEDQARADERVPDLLATPAAVRFLSCEPLLGAVNLNAVKMIDYVTDAGGSVQGWESALNGKRFDEWSDGDSEGWPKLDWVIVGGESGPGARPMHPDWARSLRDQCQSAGVPFFFKQNGEFAPGEIAGDFLDPTKAAKGYSWFDGRWDECWSEVDGRCDDEPDVYHIGKHRAGRLLDGVEWSEFPS